MIRLLFRCMACESSASAGSFPLCEDCLGYLRTCPGICDRCAAPLEASSVHRCLLPEEEPAPSRRIRLSAAYLLTTPCYQVLRAWKKRGGPAFDRRVLPPDHPALETLRAFSPELIVPVPQRWGRSMRFGGSPAEKIASWVSRAVSKPIVTPVIREGLRRAGHGLKRQAELSVQGRLENPIRFEVSQELLGDRNRRVLVVDDFLTSGRTLREAALALRDAGFVHVRGFCLGLRPMLQPRLRDQARIQFETETGRPRRLMKGA